jgi:hypothetical protein
MAKGRTRRRMELKKQRIAPRIEIITQEPITEPVAEKEEKPKPKRRPPAKKKPGPKETLSHDNDNHN